MSPAAVFVSLALAAALVASDVKIKVMHRDEAFNFKGVHA